MTGEASGGVEVPAADRPARTTSRDPDAILHAMRDVNARLDRVLTRSLVVMVATVFLLGYSAGFLFSAALVAFPSGEPRSMRSWLFVEHVTLWGTAATFAILVWTIGAASTGATRSVAASLDRRVVRLAREAADRCGAFPPDEILVTADDRVELVEAVGTGFKRSRRQLFLSGALTSPRAEPSLVRALGYQLSQRAGMHRGAAERAARFRAVVFARENESSVDGAPSSVLILVSLGRIALSLVTIAGSLALSLGRRLGGERVALAEDYARALCPDDSATHAAEDRVAGFADYIASVCRPFLAYGLVPAAAARGYDRWLDGADADAADAPGSSADDVARTLLLEANDPRGERIRAVPWSELTHERFRPIALAQRDRWVANVPRLRKAKSAYRQLDRLLSMLDAGDAAEIAIAIDGRIANLKDDTREAAVRSVVRSLLQHVFVAALVAHGGVFSDPRDHGALVVELPSSRVDVLEMVEAEAKRWGGESALRGVFRGGGGGADGEDLRLRRALLRKPACLGTRTAGI